MNKFINNINKKLILCQKCTLNNTKVIHPSKSHLNFRFFTKINSCHPRQNPNNFLRTLLNTLQIDKLCPIITFLIQQIILKKQ